MSSGMTTAPAIVRSTIKAVPTEVLRGQPLPDFPGIPGRLYTLSQLRIHQVEFILYGQMILPEISRSITNKAQITAQLGRLLIGSPGIQAVPILQS